MIWRQWAIAVAILSISASAIVAEEGPENAPRTDEDVTASLGPVNDAARAPKVTDFTRPIFTRDVAPVCNDGSKLGPFMRWLRTYKTYDPALAKSMFGCRLAQDGAAVTLLEPPKVGGSRAKVTRAKTVRDKTARDAAAIAKVGWERADGSLNYGYTWTALLRN